MTNEEFQKIVLEELKKLNEKVDNLEQGQAKLGQSQVKLEQSQTKLEQGQAKLEQSQTKLEQGQAKLEQSQTKLEQGQEKLKQGQCNLEQGQKDIRKDIKSIIEQTADLTEFREEINAKVDRVIEELNTIEIVTSKNWNDIARLKSIK